MLIIAEAPLWIDNGFIITLPLNKNYFLEKLQFDINICKIKVSIVVYYDNEEFRAIFI